MYYSLMMLIVTKQACQEHKGLLSEHFLRKIFTNQFLFIIYFLDQFVIYFKLCQEHKWLWSEQGNKFISLLVCNLSFYNWSLFTIVYITIWMPSELFQVTKEKVIKISIYPAHHRVWKKTQAKYIITDSKGPGNIWKVSFVSLGKWLIPC